MASVASLADSFLGAVTRVSEQTFLHQSFGDQSLRASYREVAGKVLTIVEALDNAGIEQGDRVVCFMDALHESVLFFLACVHAGTVAVPLDPRSSTKMLADLAERTQSVAILTTDDRVDELRRLDSKCRLLVLDPSSTPRAGADNLLGPGARETRGVVEQLARRKADPDALYLIQPTSGTTGVPKLLLRTQAPFLRHGGILRYDSEIAASRHILLNPMTHGAGPLSLWRAVSSAAELGLPSRPNVDVSLAEVRNLDPHLISAVPRILMSLRRQQVELGEPEGTNLFGPSAAFYFFGGAPCDPSLRNMLQEQGVEVVEIYGTSETGVLVGKPQGEEKDGWSGKPFADVELTLADDGELLAKSSCMMLSYLGDSEQNVKSYDDEGFYRTGDFGEISDDGWVRILGRKKDVFNTPTGNNIFPSRIESLIERAPWIEQVVLVGDGQPFLAALVVVNAASGNQLGNDVEFLCAEFLSSVNDTLEPEERVRRFSVLDESLPAALYCQVGHGKVRRERDSIESHFEGLISQMYSVTPPNGFDLNRMDALRAAGFNALNLDAKDVPHDFFSDVCERIMVPEVARVVCQALTEDVAGPDLAEDFSALCGAAKLAFTTKGRAAEVALIDALDLTRPVVLTHGLFATTQRALSRCDAQVESIALAHGLGSADVDTEALAQRLGQGGVSIVYLETANNSLFGWPLSEGNLADVRALCDEHRVRLLLDATRILGNASAFGDHYFERASRMLAMADAFTISCAKEYLTPYGAIVGSRDSELIGRAALASFQAGASVSGLEPVALRTALSAGLGYLHRHPDLIAKRAEAVTNLVQELGKRGLPVIEPASAWAAYLRLPESLVPDARAIGPLMAHMYVMAGLRAQIFFHPSGKPMLRLAVPLATEPDTVATADAVAAFLDAAERVPSFRFLPDQEHKIPYFRRRELS